MSPVGGRALGMPTLGCHCLLIESDAGLILVDTGFGSEDIERPRPRLSRLAITFGRIRFDPLDTALEQVRERGFKPADVRHIILTHLDFDHAGGITDFPAATVHVLADEATAARRRRGFIARRRYRPAQWRAAAKWQEYQADGEEWFGFPAVRRLNGLPPDILLVPLPGHSAGHCGVAVRDGARWLLHAGDAFLDQAELRRTNPRAPAGLALYQFMMRTSGRARRASLARLRELAATSGDKVTIICAHDLADLRSRQRAAELRQRAAATVSSAGDRRPPGTGDKLDERAARLP